MYIYPEELNDSAIEDLYFNELLNSYYMED